MSASTAAPAASAGKEKLDPKLVGLVVIMLLGAIPSLLDTTIVNVAIETIGRDVHTTVSSVQWVITAYLLSFEIVIPLSGWLLARFGGRAAWVFAPAGVPAAGRRRAGRGVRGGGEGGGRPERCGVHSSAVEHSPYKRGVAG